MMMNNIVLFVGLAVLVLIFLLGMIGQDVSQGRA
jgi:hypothetical protein